MRRILGVVTALAIAGCAGATDDGAGATRSDDTDERGDITVLAASSLTDVFTELGRRFEERHPDARVRFSFAASSELATQAVNGAPADVYAAASEETMAQVVDAGATAGRPRSFARNRLEIVVPAGNPGGVRSLTDLARPELDVALCAPEVPCGAAAQALLSSAGVRASVDTLEPDVRAVLTKVELGEVDAALVYRTDVLAGGDDVAGIEVPASAAAVNDYDIVVLRTARADRAARAFVRFVLSGSGRRALTEAGFELP